MFCVGLYRCVQYWQLCTYSVQHTDRWQLSADRALAQLTQTTCTEDAIKLLDTRLHNAYRIVVTKTVRQILNLSNSSNIVHNGQNYVTRPPKQKPVSHNPVLVPADSGRSIVIWNWQFVWLVLIVTAVPDCTVWTVWTDRVPCSVSLSQRCNDSCSRLNGPKPDRSLV